MYDPAQFDAIVKASNKAYAEAEERTGGARWFPPDGDYTAQIKRLERETRTYDDGSTTSVWNFILAIIDDTFAEAGREFPMSFRTISSENFSLGMFKGLARIMTGEDQPKSLDELDKLAESFSGAVVVVRVAKNAKGTYTNVDVLERCEEIPAPEPSN